VGRLSQSPDGGTAGGGFDAFLSYSHAADGRLAPALESGIETLAKPWYRRRALSVFRDQTSLSATPELWPTIVRALEQARFFILLGSRDAAQSHWVEQEVKWWLEHRSREQLLIVVTDGELDWDEEAGDFDWARTDALPRALQGAFPHEPLWVDLRWARDAEQVSLRDPRFRERVADLAAPIRGQPKDDLIGDDVRQHRRALRLARGAAATLLVLAAAAVTGAVVAINQRNEARDQARTALSRQLAAASESALEDRLDVALLLALEARRTRPTAQAEGALLRSITASPQLVRMFHQPARVIALAAAEGAPVVVTGGVDGSVRVWNTGTGRAISLRRLGRSPIGVLTLGSDGDQLLAGDEVGRVALYDLADRSQLWSQAVHRTEVTALAFGEGGEAVASADDQGTVVLSARSSGAGVNTGSTEIVRPIRLAFEPDGRLFVGGFSGQAVRLALPSLRALGPESFATTPAGAFASGYAPGGTAFAYSAVGFVSKLDVFSSRRLARFADAAPVSPDALALAPGGRRVAVAGGGSVTVLDAGRRSQTAATLRGGGSNVKFLAFGGSSRLMAADGSSVAVWDVSRRSRIAEYADSVIPEGPEAAGPNPFAVSPDGRQAVWAEEGFFPPGELVCWDAERMRETGRTPASFSILRLAFSPDGRRLVAGGERLELRTSAAGCFDDSRRLDAPNPSDAVNDFFLIAFTDDRSLVAVRASGAVELLDAATGRLRDRWFTATPTASDDRPVDLAVSPERDLAGLALTDGRVRVVDAGTGEVRAILKPDPGSAVFGAPAFGPGGGSLAAIDEGGTVTLSDVDSERVVRRLQGGQVTHLEFSPDGRLLVGLGEGGLVTVWDPSTGDELGSFPTQPPGLERRSTVDDQTTIAFDPARRLWVATRGGRPTRFDLSVGRWERLACEVAGRSLTDAEWRQYVGGEPPSGRACRGN
jgi:WD40 repeat protein